MRRTTFIICTIGLLLIMLSAAGYAQETEAVAEPAALGVPQQIAAESEAEVPAELSPGTSADVPSDGWITNEDGTKMYYRDGAFVTGFQLIDDSQYYFSPEGIMQTGFQLINDKKYYFSPEGVMQTGLQKINGHRYYFSPKGVMKTGFKTIDGKRYYFGPKGAMRTGFEKINGKRYYFSPKGVMQTGFKKINGHRYYFSPRGVMQTGFKTINGHRYYFGKRGVMKTGFQTIEGYRYYFGERGVMKTGTVRVDGRVYYFFDSGKGLLSKGWFTGSDKKKRYGLGYARVMTGTQKVSGIWYVFSDYTGCLIRRIGDDVDKKFQSYTSSTRYMIVVKLSEHKVRIYNGSKNNWTRIHTYTCTTGAPSTPTIKGTFTVKAKGLYFNTGTSQRCWYYTQFCGNYLFHSVIYDRSSSPVNIVDGRLGISASHGCIRLALSNAHWIYSNIPSGSKVVIY